MKNTVFNADEILAIAEQIERNGAKFYRRAAEGQEKADFRDLLVMLADMEDDHELVFAAMRKDFDQEQPWDPDLQVAGYLNAVADGLVFDVRPDPSEKLTGREAPEEIIEMAIGQEKDSVVFYLGMKEAVPENLGKEMIDKIIREEMGHITILTKALAALRDEKK